MHKQQASPRTASPFSALSREEQQAKWLAWQSQRMTYTQVERESAPPARETPPAAKARSQAELPALKLPMYRQAAPAPRHGQLDALRKKHMQAARQAQIWQSAQPSADT